MTYTLQYIYDWRKQEMNQIVWSGITVRRTGVRPFKYTMTILEQLPSKEKKLSWIASVSKWKIQIWREKKESQFHYYSVYKIVVFFIYILELFTCFDKIIAPFIHVYLPWNTYIPLVYQQCKLATQQYVEYYLYNCMPKNVCQRYSNMLNITCTIVCQNMFVSDTAICLKLPVQLYAKHVCHRYSNMFKITCTIVCQNMFVSDTAICLKLPVNFIANICTSRKYKNVLLNPLVFQYFINYPRFHYSFDKAWYK